MSKTNPEDAGRVRLRRYGWTLIGLWTTAVGATLIWELIDERDHARQIARGAAREAFENAKHLNARIDEIPDKIKEVKEHIRSSPKFRNSFIKRLLGSKKSR